MCYKSPFCFSDFSSSDNYYSPSASSDFSYDDWNDYDDTDGDRINEDEDEDDLYSWGTPVETVDENRDRDEPDLWSNQHTSWNDPLWNGGGNADDGDDDSVVYGDVSYEDDGQDDNNQWSYGNSF